MKKAKTEEEYLAIAESFDGIKDYKDSNENANLCRVSAEEARALAEEAYNNLIREGERENRYRKYCSKYSEQLELQKLVIFVQEDLKGLYEILEKDNHNKSDKKYIKQCIRDQEKKLSQYQKTLKKLPVVPDFV